MSDKFKATHSTHSEIDQALPKKVGKRPADGDQPGNPEMTSLPDGDPRTKAQMISDMARLFAHMSKEELAELYDAMSDDSMDEAFDAPTGEVDDDTPVTDEVPAPEAMPKAPGPHVKQWNDKMAARTGSVREALDLTSHIDALKSAGVEAGLSEEFLTKIVPIFETAVADAAMQTALSEEAMIEEARMRLVETLDSFCDVTVSEWMDNNEIAIEDTLQTEVARDFLVNLRGLFEQSHIYIPETKRDIVEELVVEKEDIESAFAALAERHAEMEMAYEDLIREMIVRTECADLTEADVDKALSMSEDISFESPDVFAQKVQTLRENYFKTSGEVLAEHNDVFVPAETPAKTGITTTLNEALFRMSPHRGRK